MPKTIEFLVRSTPDNPGAGYGDQVTVYDGLSIYGGHASTCPNPFRYVNGAKIPWDKCVAWVAPGEYAWEYLESHPLFGPCILINGGGQVPTRNANANHGGAHYATEIFIHKGGMKSKDPKWRGSVGCFTIPPENWESFICLFHDGDKGILMVKDFLNNQKEVGHEERQDSSCAGGNDSAAGGCAGRISDR